MNRVQELQLELVRNADDFNGFDSRVVSKALEQSEDLWEAFMMKNEAFCFSENHNGLSMDWTELAYLSDGIWRSESLYILAERGQDHNLFAFCEQTMGADEIDWVKEDDLDYTVRGRKILRVWWD